MELINCDICLEISKYLCPKTIIKCAQLSKQFNVFFLCDSIWNFQLYLIKDDLLNKITGVGYERYCNYENLLRKLDNLNKMFETRLTKSQLYFTQHLTLDYRSIKAIPEEIGQLVNLRYLCLGRDKI